jgi:tungstate transport system substrate-binding protein
VRQALLAAAATALLLFLMVSTLASGQPRLRLATTTSLYDTGLWGALEPMFEERYDVALDILYAGTGKALEWGRRGDVDVVTTHSLAREEQFVAEGYGVERVPFASNYFLIVGPTSDPAGIGGMAPENAFSRLVAQGETNTGVKFVSRGDNSGTHERERTIWTAAGFDYEAVRDSGWYVEGGSGMGPTLVMADEMRAYTLSDIGTFLAYHGDLDLAALVDKGEVLLNVYSVIVTTTARDEEAARKMVDFLLSDEIQQLIGSYGEDDYGRRLFTAVAGESAGVVGDD